MDYALKFDGSQNYVSLGTVSTQLASLPSFYIAFQFKAFSTSNGNYSKLVFCGGLFDLGINNNGQLFFEFHTVSNDYNIGVFYNTSIYDNEIHLLQIVWDGNNVNCYIDKVSVFSQSGYTDASGLASVPDEFVVGYNKGNGHEFFSGILDNFQLGETSSDLLAWYKMNEGTGTTLNDSSGNSNNGTLEGSPVPAWVSGLDIVGPFPTFFTF